MKIRCARERYEKKKIITNKRTKEWEKTRKIEREQAYEIERRKKKVT